MEPSTYNDCCYICDRRIPQFKYRFIRHLRDFHGNETTFTCNFPGCSSAGKKKCFFNISKFIRHFNAHNPDSHISENSSSTSSSSVSGGSQSFDSTSDFQISGSSQISAESLITCSPPSLCSSSPLVPDNNTPPLTPPLSPSKETHNTLPRISPMMRILLQLHNRNNFARSDVLFVQELIVEFAEQQLTSFENFGNKLSLSSDEQLQLISFLSLQNQSLTECNTEFKLLKQLQQLELCGTGAEKVEIDCHTVITHKHGVATVAEKRATISVMPIPFQFKLFFECNDTLLRSLHIMEKFVEISFATHSNISFVNFCQGPLWHQKSAPFRAEGRIVLPYFLYADETEMNNGLGPHASPSFQVYYSFPFLDQSPLFTAAIIEKEVYKKYGNTRCLRPILEVLKSLEIDGIEILTSAGIKQVHFVLGLVLGDNAGINKMLGFKSCAATCGCRFCKMPQKDLKVTSKLDKNLLRSKASYAVDSVSADDSSGVSEACVFHLLPSFHVQDNFFVDVMHDWFEGVSRYLLVHILNIASKSIVTSPSPN